MLGKYSFHCHVSFKELFRAGPWASLITIPRRPPNLLVMRENKRMSMGAKQGEAVGGGEEEMRLEQLEREEEEKGGDEVGAVGEGGGGDPCSSLHTHN